MTCFVNGLVKRFFRESERPKALFLLHVSLVLLKIVVKPWMEVGQKGATSLIDPLTLQLN